MRAPRQRRAALRWGMSGLVVALLVPLCVALAAPARADMGTQFAAAATYAAGRGQVGISVLDRDTGKVYENGALAHAQMRSASVPKALVAESLIRRSRSGAITLTAKDRSLLEAMVMRSDDAAMSSLYSRFGGLGMVTEVVGRYGLSEIGGPPTPGYWGMFRITAHDIVKFYDGVLDGGLQAADRDYFVTLMRRATPYGADGFDQFFGIPRGLPNQTWGVKQGWMCCQEGKRRLHTTGILGTDNRFVVAVLSTVPDARSYAYSAETLTGVVRRLFPDGQIPTSSAAHNPRGDVNRASQTSPGVFRLEGWTFDPDDPARSLEVHTYVDGRYAARGLATVPRADVAAAFPAAGRPHGFRVDVRVPQGRHDVCVYAINVGAGDRNPRLGCRSVTAQLSPIGSLDKVAAAGVRTARVTGWTFDPEVPAQPQQVKLHVDGKYVSTVVADARRADVAQAYPAAGFTHGFRADVPISSGGSHQVCAYGVNAPGSGGGNALLGCGTVSLPTGVLGALDRVDTVAPGQYDLVGWALDTSKRTTPLQVHVYVDGRYRSAATAGGSRPDLAAAYPDAGRLHGYVARVRLGPGTHSVCVYAIRATTAGTNPQLGCRTLRG
jgi:hypothetical protein